MRKIVCVHVLSSDHYEHICNIAPEWKIVHGKEEELWLHHLKDAEIVVGWNRATTKECFQPDAKLRWVQNWGAGVDNLPLEEFAARGISLTTSSGVHAFPISETIFAMMLSLARNLHHSMRNQIQKKWKGMGKMDEIHGKTIGIIGVGAIGAETARIAKVFGMNVLGVRRSGELSPFVDRMYDNKGLGEVLKNSDYVVVTLPLTKETRHMFGWQEFQTMKPTAFFINIGRGGTTDTNALIKALKNGTIAGAGLDVFEQEPLPETSSLWDLENLIITPHNSGGTIQYTDRVIEIFSQNLNDYLQGSELSLNRVDFEKQY